MKYSDSSILIDLNSSSNLSIKSPLLDHRTSSIKNSSFFTGMRKELGTGGALLLALISVLIFALPLVTPLHAMKGQEDNLLSRSSTSNFTPLPVSQSRLPVARALKRASSPDNSGVLEDLENYYYPSSQTATPSPSKQGKIGGVADIVKQRLFSLTPSPSKIRTAVAGGIFSNSSTAQSTRRLSLGAPGTGSTGLNAYGIRSDLSPVKTSMDVNNTSRRRSSLISSETDRIKVCVRKRPLSQKEIRSNHQDILELNTGAQSVAVLEDRVRLDGISRYIEKHEFRFDRVFNVDSTNHEIYSSCVQELVDTVISGGRATCFAYGQTGSGKTHTMLNPGDGLNHLAAHDLFAQTSRLLPNVVIYVTFYEIYQNSLYDLLNQKRRVMACEGKNGEVHIVGITEVPVNSEAELQEITQEALNTRSTGSTAANSTSSRSHAILQFILKNKATCAIHGKFSFIDLAGSERGSDRANVDKQTKLEGAEINKSLLALKECIRAIDQDSSHLPFRQSKLTLVLKDSFTGNAKTCMIATVSPSSANCEHTINTLRYADRVKELKGNNNNAGSVSEISSPLVKQFNSVLPVRSSTLVPSVKPIAQPNSRLQEKFEIANDYLVDNLSDYDDEIMESSPLKLTESDDSFLLSTLTSSQKSKPPNSTPTASIPKLKESLHHSIAVLYDRVSACNDADLLELLGEEMEGLLAAFNK